MSWEDSAVCAGWPPELFQTTNRGNPAPGVRESLCAHCPVAAPCLADGWWDECAIRGGMLPRERKALAEFLRRGAAEEQGLTG